MCRLEGRAGSSTHIRAGRVAEVSAWCSRLLNLIGLCLKPNQSACRGLASPSEPALEKAPGLGALLEVLQALESSGLHFPSLPAVKYTLYRLFHCDCF